MKIEIRENNENLIILKGRALREIIAEAVKLQPCDILCIANLGPTAYEALVQKLEQKPKAEKAKKE